MQSIQQLKDKFVSDISSLIEEVNKFNSLSDYQINWKPSPENWSIAECFDHLIVTNKLYLNEFEEQFSHKQIKTNCAITIVKHKTFAKFIIKSVDPSNIKKLKTFKVFNPSKSNHTKEVINTYINLQKQFINVVLQSNDLNLNEYIMSSPATKFLKENFCDVLEIIRLHDRRHFNQANRILNHSNFTKN